MSESHKNNKSSRIGIILPVPVAEKLKQISDTFGLTVSGLIKSVIHTYLIENKFLNVKDSDDQ